LADQCESHEPLEGGKGRDLKVTTRAPRGTESAIGGRTKGDGGGPNKHP